MSLAADWRAARSRPVVRRAALMALVVGHVIGAINHGDAILAGAMGSADWVKVAVTFAVPYCVSTFSSVLAIRERDLTQAPGPTEGAPLPPVTVEARDDR